MAENNNTTNTKDIATLSQETIQDVNSGADSAYIGDMGWLNNMAQSGELAPRWWSHGRDEYLFAFAMRSNYFASAQYKVASKLTAIAPRVLPRNPNIKQHQALAAEYQKKLIEASDFGQGWQSLFSKSLFDYFSQDNGAFIEVIGAGRKDGPIVGPAMGLAALDASRCSRTGNWEYPVVYQANNAKYKLHWTRVIAIANNPPNRANKNGVGFCWLSRCLDISQSLLDMIIYKQEKLGSRPLRQMLIGRGISASQIAGAIKMAESSMDNQGLNVYSKSVVIGSTNTEIDVEIKDLASVPDGFDFQTDLELGMFAIALAGGIPPRDIWPATTTGATKADAMFQHIGGSAGYSTILDNFANAIGGNPNTPTSLYSRFLPPSLKMIFDFVDDSQDEMSAVIAKTRSESRERDIAGGVITVRVARQQMVENSELSVQQFDSLELSDGRLPDGTPILRLFNSTDDFTLDLLEIGIPEPLDLEANMANRDAILSAIDGRLRYAEVVVVNTARDTQRKKAEQAIAALGELRKLYDVSVDNQEVEDSIEETEDEPEPEEDEETEVKQAGGGEDLPPEVDEYEAAIAALIAQGSNEEISPEEFAEQVEEITIAFITLVFLAGAGLASEDDMNEEQAVALAEEIDNGTASIDKLTEEVFTGAFVPIAEGGQGHNIIARSALWAVFLAGVFEMAKLYDFGRDPYLQWNISPGKDSCKDCIRLNKQVHRRQAWLSSGWQPKRRNLECKGYNCGCYFVEVSGPARGRF